MPTAEARCSDCGEDLYFVEGVIGPARWRHVRTDAHACAPLCAVCGAAGEIKIGRSDLDGGQRPCFVLHHWECAACAQHTCRIEYIR